AKLRMTAAPVSAAPSPNGGELHTITDNVWSEGSTTFANRPAVDGPIVATAGAVTDNALIDFDVVSVVRADGTYNFALITTSSDEVVYQSREATAGKPQLILPFKQNTPRVVRIGAPATGSIVNVGGAVSFQATATDAESGNLSNLIQWSSDLDGALGSGAARTITTLRPGVHTITARVTDAGGLVGQSKIKVQVGHTPEVA